MLAGVGEEQEQEQEQEQHEDEAYQRFGLSASITLSFANLPPHTDLTFLKELVSPFGDVLTAHIDIDPAAVIAAATGTALASDSSPTAPRARPLGLCAGRGFVQVRGMEQAQRALLALNGTTPASVDGRKMGALGVALTVGGHHDRQRGGLSLARTQTRGEVRGRDIDGIYSHSLHRF
jgi:hypothetical protein